MKGVQQWKLHWQANKVFWSLCFAQRIKYLESGALCFTMRMSIFDGNTWRRQHVMSESGNRSTNTALLQSQSSGWRSPAGKGKECPRAPVLHAFDGAKTEDIKSLLHDGRRRLAQQQSAHVYTQDFTWKNHMDRQRCQSSQFTLRRRFHIIKLSETTAERCPLFLSISQLASRATSRVRMPRYVLNKTQWFWGLDPFKKTFKDPISEGSSQRATFPRSADQQYCDNIKFSPQFTTVRFDFWTVDSRISH